MPLSWKNRIGERRGASVLLSVASDGEHGTFLCDCGAEYRCVLPSQVRTISGNCPSCKTRKRGQIPAEDRVGTQRGTMTLVSVMKARRPIASLRCTCGNEYTASLSNWLQSQAQTCPKCQPSTRRSPEQTRAMGLTPLEDRIGTRHGKLVITAVLPTKKGNIRVQTRCDCGTKEDIYLSSILSRGKIACARCGKAIVQHDRVRARTRLARPAVPDNGKPVRLDIRVYNANLIRAREQLGYKSASAAACGLLLECPRLRDYEALRISPLDKHGQWQPSALRIATAYKTTPSALWPDAILAVQHNQATAYLDTEDICALLPTVSTPEDALARKELEETLVTSLDVLTPRERKIVEHRFGLNDEGITTLADIGDGIKVSRERVRQIEATAITKLRRRLLATLEDPELLALEALGD